MAQLQPQGFPPPPPGAASYGGPTVGPVRWSAAAIAALVLSLLGFLGVTAILGLIFAVVGILTTRGGKRKGMGLAIAAIPISLVTGAISVLLVVTIVFFGRAVQLGGKMEAIFSAKTESAGDAAVQLRGLGSSGFQESVSAAELEAWIRSVGEKNGKITSIGVDRANAITPNPKGDVVLNLQGKFVNGPATIRITLSKESPLHPRIEDIEIGGSSPRASPDTKP